MRYTQIAVTPEEMLSEEILNEVNMSPSNLRRLAKTIDARVGMEFEMVVPSLEDPDREYDDSDREPDYEMDEAFPTNIRRWRQTMDNFWRNGPAAPSRREISNVCDTIWEEFEEHARGECQEKVNNVTTEFVRRVRNNMPDDATDEDVTAAIESDDQPAQDALEEMVDEMVSDDDEFESFLTLIGIETMMDVGRLYDLSWPYLEEQPENAGENWEDVGRDFAHAVDRRVNVSGSYHGSSKSSTAYTMEPDSSISSSGRRGGHGAEFVSPPLTLDQMFTDLERVKQWSEKNRCYTNSSTGLHINVSLPGYEIGKLDYIKLALFIGDEYVSNEFGRLGASYARSAMGKIRSRLSANPDIVPEVMAKMREHLMLAASKLVHSGITEKYTSINTKDNRVEFRSPGGDWLTDLKNSPDKIPNTIMRFVVGLDAAMDPDKYRDEYAKKLYKLLTPQGGDDIISLFSKYSAGQINRNELKDRLLTKRGRGPDQELEPIGTPDQELEPIGTPAGVVDYGIGSGPNRYRIEFANKANERTMMVVRGSSRRSALAAFVDRYPTASYRVIGMSDIEITDNSEAQARAAATPAEVPGASSHNPYGIRLDVQTVMAAREITEWDLIGPNGILLGRSDPGTGFQALEQFTSYVRANHLTLQPGCVLRAHRAGA